MHSNSSNKLGLLRHLIYSGIQIAAEPFKPNRISQYILNQLKAFFQPHQQWRLPTDCIPSYYNAHL